MIQISGGHVGRSYLKPQCARRSPSNPALGIYLDKYSWACIGVFITIWFATVKNQKESKSLLRESVKRLLSGRHVVRSRLSCSGFKGQCRSSGSKREAAGSAQSALYTHWKHKCKAKLPHSVGRQTEMHGECSRRIKLIVCFLWRKEMELLFPLIIS